MNFISPLLRVLVSFAFVGAVLAGPVAARASSVTSGKISGNVVSTESGRGIPGAIVRVGGTGAEVTTTLEGTFTIEQVPTGEYNVSAVKAGHQPITVTGVAVTDGETSRVDLPLAADGFEVCRRLRSDEATASIPVIFLTKRAGEMDRIVGLELGADDYVTKPFSAREFILRIKRTLRQGKPEKTSTMFMCGGWSWICGDTK